MSEWLEPPPVPMPPLQRAQHADVGRDGVTAVRYYWHASQEFFDAGAYEQAAAALVRATQLAPDRPDFHNALAQCLTRLGRPQDAAVSYRRAALRASAQGQDAWAAQLNHTAEFLSPSVAPQVERRAGAFAGPQTDRGAPSPDLGPITEPDTVVLEPSEGLGAPTTGGEPIDEPEIIFIEDDDEDVEPIENTAVEVQILAGLQNGGRG